MEGVKVHAGSVLFREKEITRDKFGMTNTDEKCADLDLDSRESGNDKLLLQGHTL